MNSALGLLIAISLISYGMPSDVKVKCAGPPADVSSIPQLSSETHPSMGVNSNGGGSDSKDYAHPSMGVNSNGGESEAGYRARVNRLRLMKWKAKLARKFRRRLAL